MKGVSVRVCGCTRACICCARAFIFCELLFRIHTNTFYFSVFSDGQVNEENSVLQLINTYSNNTRVFSFGVGKNIRHHIVHTMAR